MADHLGAARDALAAAIYDSPELSLAEIEETVNSLPPETFERWARATVERHLDSLLGELPEEAVEAAEERFSARLPVSVEYVHIVSRRNIAGEALRAALRSLRDSLASGREDEQHGV